MLPPSYWCDEHPAGIAPLKGYANAVRDLDAAVELYCGLFEAAVVAEEHRPAIGARTVGLKIADSLIELVTPTGAGTTSEFIARYGEGIMSTLFGVKDKEHARAYFAQRNVELVPGSTDCRWAIPATDNAGALFELDFDA